MALRYFQITSSGKKNWNGPSFNQFRESRKRHSGKSKMTPKSLTCPNQKFGGSFQIMTLSLFLISDFQDLENNGLKWPFTGCYVWKNESRRKGYVSEPPSSQLQLRHFGFYTKDPECGCSKLKILLEWSSGNRSNQVRPPAMESAVKSWQTTWCFTLQFVWGSHHFWSLNVLAINSLT